MDPLSINSKVHNPPVGLSAWLTELRPRQWTKNLFVFAALLFTGQTGSWSALGQSTAAFLIFCLLSSSVYLLNDIVDRQQDQLHPVKRLRPIAAGTIPIGAAAVAAMLIGPGAAILGLLLGSKFAAVCASYLLLQLLYSFWLKHAVLLDVFAIAAGFVLRAIAGAVALNVSISVWLLVCTFQLALFLGFGKRRNELTDLAEEAAKHRRNLSKYTVAFLDPLMIIVLSGLTVSYAVYTIMSPTAIRHPMLVITLPNVMYGVFRYLYLIHSEGQGGSPETILLTDRATQINVVVWLAAVILSMKWGI